MIFNEKGETLTLAFILVLFMQSIDKVCQIMKRLMENKRRFRNFDVLRSDEI